MKDRGNINIEFAEHYFNKNKSDDNNGNSDKNKSEIKKSDGEFLLNGDINHIAIGRYYYGVYLLARNKLIKEFNYKSYCKRKINCNRNYQNC